MIYYLTIESGKYLNIIYYSVNMRYTPKVWNKTLSTSVKLLKYAINNFNLKFEMKKINYKWQLKFPTQ